MEEKGTSQRGEDGKGTPRRRQCTEKEHHGEGSARRGTPRRVGAVERREEDAVPVKCSAYPSPGSALWVLGFLGFEFVSDFGFRDSNFARIAAWRNEAAWE
jgi:hypothetical protein